MRAQNLLKSALASSTLALSVLVGIAPVHALSLEKVPAPWVNKYRASGSTSSFHVTSTTTANNGKRVGILSNIKVNY